MLSKQASRVVGVRGRRCFFGDARQVDDVVYNKAPLSQYWPGNEKLSSATDNQSHRASGTEFTSIRDGQVSVITRDDAKAGCSFEISFASGPNAESAETVGASHFLTKLLLRSNVVRSHFTFTRKMEDLGATFDFDLSTRDSFKIRAQCLRGQAGEVFSLIAEGALLPRFSPHEVSAAKAELLSEIRSQKKSDLRGRLINKVHQVAFQGQPAGQGSAICPEYQVEYLSQGSRLQDFHDSTFRPLSRGTVLSVLNCEHAEVVDAASKYLAEEYNCRGITSLRETTPSSKYIGGEYRRHLNTGKVLGALAFQTDNNNDAALAVLEKVLGQTEKGGVKVYSKFGGAHSKFGSALNYNEHSTSVEAFHQGQASCGLIGAVISSNPGAYGSALESVLKIVKETAASPISDEALSLGKAAALRSLYENSYYGVSGVAFQTASVRKALLNTSDKARTMSIGTVDDVAEAIKNVTAQDVQKAARNAFNAEPTLVSYGDLRSAPFLYQIN